MALRPLSPRNAHSAKARSSWTSAAAQFLAQGAYDARVEHPGSGQSRRHCRRRHSGYDPGPPAAKPGYRVTLIEAAAEIGGLAGSQSIGGYTWDRYYHVILQSDQHLQALLQEIGLGDSLRWGTTRTGFYTGGRLHSMSDSLEFVRFPALSLIDKARLAFTILYASRLRDWRPLERIPVVDWLRRLSGKRTVERIWLPLLKAKLGENYRITSASFIWATIARMYAARRSGLKREMFGYVEGGYSRVLARFREDSRPAASRSSAAGRSPGWKMTARRWTCTWSAARR